MVDIVCENYQEVRLKWKFSIILAKRQILRKAANSTRVGQHRDHWPRNSESRDGHHWFSFEWRQIQWWFCVCIRDCSYTRTDLIKRDHAGGQAAGACTRRPTVTTRINLVCSWRINVNVVRRQCQLIYEVSARIEARPRCHRCIVTTRALAVETAAATRQHAQYIHLNSVVLSRMFFMPKSQKHSVDRHDWRTAFEC